MIFKTNAESVRCHSDSLYNSIYLELNLSLIADRLIRAQFAPNMDTAVDEIIEEYFPRYHQPPLRNNTVYIAADLYNIVSVVSWNTIESTSLSQELNRPLPSFFSIGVIFHWCQLSYRCQVILSIFRHPTLQKQCW